MSSAFSSYAKINLHLQVVGVRPDGYHELRTVFQSIDLHDEIGIELDGIGVELEVCHGEAPPGAANLAHRAATGFLERWGGASGVRLSLWKHLPIGGGLGGGSSNAATVLLGLRRLTGSPATVSELWPLARSLGADVPFFLYGGTALGFGRGDELVQLPDLEPAEVVLVLPPVHASTREVFKAIGRLTESPLAPSIMRLLDGCKPCRLEEVAGRNDLAETVLLRYPEIREVFASLNDSGVTSASLSGSGSTIFVYGPSVMEASKFAQRLPEGVRLLHARTLKRADCMAGRLFDEGRAADEHH